MPVAATREEYREQLHGLLPQGEAWPKHAGTVLDRLLDAFAGPFLEADDGARGVLGESVPSGAFHLLPEWEEMFGLPDDCSDLSQTVGGRRAAVMGRMVSVEGASPHDIIAFGRRWGYALRVRVPDSEADVTGVTLDVTGARWRFVWYVDHRHDRPLPLLRHRLGRPHPALPLRRGVPGRVHLPAEGDRAGAHPARDRVLRRARDPHLAGPAAQLARRSPQMARLGAP